MQLGLFSDCFPGMSLAALLEVSAELGIRFLELGCGNWSPAPHVNLDQLLESSSARREFLAQFRDHDVEISALNCSGNHLAPNRLGRIHESVVKKTIKLASLLRVGRVVLTSGCPGGPGDANANWIVTDWPPEVRDVLQWQWHEVAIPFWQDLVAYTHSLGVQKLCIEPHGGQLVYNTSTLLKLRSYVGEIVGANMDPSHFFWMGGDPIAATRHLGNAIYFVHGKDTDITPFSRPNTLLETLPMERTEHRSWNFVTIGDGHSKEWWTNFLFTLSEVGYEDVVSIEQEDCSSDVLVGVRQAVLVIQDCLGWHLGR